MKKRHFFKKLIPTPLGKLVRSLREHGFNYTMYKLRGKLRHKLGSNVLKRPLYTKADLKSVV